MAKAGKNNETSFPETPLLKEAALLEKLDTKVQSAYDIQGEMIRTLLKASKSNVPASYIKKWAAAKYPAVFAKIESSWNSYISDMGRNGVESGFERVPDTYSYRLYEKKEEVVLSAQEVATDGEPPLEAREKRLYPVISDWLRTKMAGGYKQVDVTANCRAGKKWGNPDVTGIKIIEGLLAQREIEIVTVEAKSSLKDWKQFLFEAVSHKRFSNRAYFVFAFGTDTPSIRHLEDSIADSTIIEMKEYSEKYGIGVAVVFVPTKEYQKLMEGRASDANMDEAVVEILSPAQYETVTASARNFFLKITLDIQTDDGLFSWGKK